MHRSQNRKKVRNAYFNTLHSLQGNTLLIVGANERDRLEGVSCFELKFGFCYDRYIEIDKSDLLCFRLKGVPCRESKLSAGNLIATGLR